MGHSSPFEMREEEFSLVSVLKDGKAQRASDSPQGAARRMTVLRRMADARVKNFIEEGRARSME
jgi:hypothetical protein